MKKQIITLIVALIAWNQVFCAQNIMIETGKAVDQRKGEDAYLIEDNINNRSETYLLGVFDGHMGKFTSHKLEDEFEGTFEDALNDGRKPALALKTALIQIDTKINDQSGSTATVAYIENDTLHLAHIGDSRAVLQQNGRAIQLTTDHIPHNPKNPNPTQEMQRLRQQQVPVVHYEFPQKPNDLWWIERAGGYPLTRSIGARGWKDNYPAILNTPQNLEQPLTAEDEFLILATDGLWDFVDSNETVTNVVAIQFQQGKSAENAARALIDLARRNNSSDDIAVVIARFIH